MLPTEVAGQNTRIMGKVLDAGTGEPVPFANVFFLGTTIGATTDFHGNFAIETDRNYDTLVVSCVGYEKETKIIQPGRFQEIFFELNPGSISLPEVVVVAAGENPAEVLLRKVISHKDQNYKKKLDAYQYEAYNKIEVDANNITEKFRDRRIMKPFRFIFDYVDTSTINGKTYLPIFLSESLSDYYYRSSPRAEKEIIRAANISGIENESVLQYLGDMFQNYSIYENYITLFQKNFVSPIADFGLNFYKYYLVDSAWFDNKWCYQVMFTPRRQQELTFDGHFWVHDTSYAVKSFEIRIAKDANINFVNDLVLVQKFDLIDGEYWMVVLDKAVGDFNVFEDNETVLGFFGRKTTTYRKFVLNRPLSDDFYASPTNVVIAENAYQKDEAFWKESRHQALSKNEQTIYFMVDTLKNLPAFKTWVDIVETAVTGYLDLGKVEVGPYASMLSFNAVEGTRFRFGGRTTPDFSEKTRYSVYTAYGTHDKKFKYGGSALFLLNPNPRRALTLDYKYDIEQLGNSPNAFREDFLLAVVFRRNPADKLSLAEEWSVDYEHEWFNGFTNNIRLMRKEIIPVGETSIRVNGEGNEIREKNSIIATEVTIGARMAYREKFVMSTFDRYSLGTKFPILWLQYSYGIPGFIDGQYEYHKVSVAAKHWFNVMGLGWSKYILEAGKIWGTLPFPLLHLHPGNETFIFDEYAFNLMNYFEFISDEYVSLYYTHHFDGFFLNHIPLMRKLKWREVLYFRGTIGALNTANINYNQLPEISHTLNRPYFEAGAGIENIFKVFRVDGIWRLSHLDHENINNFAVFLSFYFSF